MSFDLRNWETRTKFNTITGIRVKMETQFDVKGKTAIVTGAGSGTLSVCLLVWLVGWGLEFGIVHWKRCKYKMDIICAYSVKCVC